jgi:hypothetical protein
MTLPALWLSIVLTCSVVPEKDVSFVRSADIPGEAIQTLIVIGHIDCEPTTTVLPKAEDTPHFIQLAVGNSILSCWAQAQGVLAIASANLPRQLALSLSRNPGF